MSSRTHSIGSIRLLDEIHQSLAIYLHLARASELRRRWLVRDKLLLMSAIQAYDLGLSDLAEHCRERLLAHNPGHLLGRFTTAAAASEDDGIRLLIQQAERIFSREKAEHMLHTLGIELGRSEATYDSPDEYLRSILGPQPRLSGDRGRSAAVEAPLGDLTHSPDLNATEIAARERRELRALCAGIAGLTLGILVYFVFLLTR